MEIIRVEKCRSCQGDLEDLWELGDQHIVGFYKPGEVPEEPKVPLTLAMCQEPACGLVQLRDSVERRRLFGQDYWYRSGINESMKVALLEIAIAAQETVDLQPGDTVIDIGANDGTLLSCYRVPVVKVAYEPSESFREALKGVADAHFQDFFPSSRTGEVPETRKAKVITAIAMLYDLDDPNAFVAEVKRLLHPDGVFIAQFSDISTLVDQAAFDSICHEHLEYYSLKSLIYLFGQHGLMIQKVERNSVNGGSLRVYVRHSGRVEHDWTLQHYLNVEGHTYFPETYDALASVVSQAKYQVREILAGHDGPVTAYGASTKGLTLMQHFGLEYPLPLWVAERNEEKFGLLYGNTGIQIVDEATWRQKPSLALVLPWHFRGGILERERDWLAAGGRFLFPLPRVENIGSVE